MFIKSKKKDFGIFLILGMNKKQLRKILFIENMVIGSLAVVIGIILGIVFSKFFLIIISSILEIEELKFYFSIKVIVITVFRYLALFYIVPIFIGRIIKFKNVIDLINYKKEENTKIKVSLIKSIISTIVIILGYFAVLTSDINNILSTRLLIILMLFVLGNYLFFYYIINYIVYLISKAKKIYLNKINFLFLSSLKYRLYDNISMLFIVTILLAVSFTAIGAVYIQKSILKSDAVKNSPFSLNYFVNDYSKYDEDEKFIDDILKSNNLKYNKSKLHIIQIFKRGTEKNERYSFNLIKQSEYNNIVHIVKRKPVNLQKKETILVPNYEDMTELEKRYIGQKIKFYQEDDFIIKSNVEGCIAFKGMLFNTFIVPDKEFDRMYDKYNKKIFIGYEVERWEEIKNITEKIKYESEILNKSRNIDNLFLSRMYAYGMEKTTNSILMYFTFFIGTILYLAAVSFMNYKFYVELEQEQNKYSNMMSLGLTFNELKKIISKEMMVILFVPYIMATIDAIFAYRILYIVYEIPILKSILQVQIIFFIINLLYFFIWRFKNINFLAKNKTHII
nr:ABC transporter permease [Clostridium ganghwense]